MSEPDGAKLLQIGRRSRASFCRRAKSSQIQNRASGVRSRKCHCKRYKRNAKSIKSYLLTKES